MICPKCKWKNSEESRFCSYCGTELFLEKEQTKTGKSKGINKKALKAVVAIVLVITSAVVGKNLFYDKKVSAENDAEMIVGTWKLNKDKTDTGWGFDDNLFPDYVIFESDHDMWKVEHIRYSYNNDNYVFSEQVDTDRYPPFEYDNWNIVPWYKTSKNTGLNNFFDCFYSEYEIDDDELILYLSNGVGYEEIYYDRIDDDDIIVGKWTLHDDYYADIKTINFYSDGTCAIEGSKGTESGNWSIVDDNLKVVGAYGEMFWNYKGFLAKYDLYADAIVIYDDDEKEVVWRVYEREEE